PARLLLSSNGIECPNPLTLSGATGTVGVQGVLSRQGMSDLTVTFSRFMATDWLATLSQNRFLVEGLDARVHLSGPLLRPQIIAKGNIAKLAGKDAPLSLAGIFDLSYSSEGVVIRSFEWTGAGGHRITLLGNIPFDPIGEKRFLPGEISLTGRAEVPEIAILSFFLPAGLAMKGRLSADVALRGTWDDPFGELRWSAKDLILPASIKPCPPGPFALDGEITVQGSEARLKNFHLEAQDVVLTASGQWDGMPQFGNAIRGGIIPLDGMVSGQGIVKCRDISWLADRIKGIRRLSGAVDAEWSVKGPLRQPEVSGTLSLANGELRPESSTVPPIKAVSGAMAVKGRTITIENLAGELGGSP
ncbi:MAG: hypothetical protein Q8M56_11200, partial [Desulfobacterales bacterium]|nr:hypothetical protein [Desulfobacterales bacterium]